MSFIHSVQHMPNSKSTIISNTKLLFTLKCCVFFTQNMRIDTYISSLPLQLSRSQIRQLISKIIVNNKQVKLSYPVNHKDYLEIYFNIPSPKKTTEHKKYLVRKETLKLDIIYEDTVLLVINKAKGQLVHTGNGHRDSITIADLVLEKLLSYREEDKLHARAGIVHRLDKDTSGSLLVAKTAEAHTVLSNQFQERLIEKKYLAIVKGMPPKEQDTVVVNMDRHKIHRKRFVVVSQGGRETITQYKILYTNGNYTVLLFTPHTGRTHQLRVLAQYLGCPILGDELYARKSQEFPFVKLMLHALTISLYHPTAICNYLQNQKKHIINTQVDIHDNPYFHTISLRSIIDTLALPITTYESPIATDMQRLFETIGYRYRCL